VRPFLEKTHHKKRTGGVAEDVALSSNSSIKKTRRDLEEESPWI
jgi:hypothetical protein